MFIASNHNSSDYSHLDSAIGILAEQEHLAATQEQ